MKKDLDGPAASGSASALESADGVRADTRPVAAQRQRAPGQRANVQANAPTPRTSRPQSREMGSFTPTPEGPVDVPPTRFDDVRVLAADVCSYFEIELTIPPPGATGQAIRFLAKDAAARQKVLKYLSDRLKIPVADGMPLFANLGEPINIPRAEFGKVREFAIFLMRDYDPDDLCITVPSDTAPQEACIMMRGLKAVCRNARVQLGEKLGMAVEVGRPTDGPPEKKIFLLNVKRDSFNLLREHVTLIKSDFGVEMKVPEIDVGKSTTDKVSLCGKLPCANLALEFLRKQTLLPIHFDGVPSGAGIKEIVIFHDGENLHLGGDVDAQKLYEGFVRGIRTSIGFTADPPPDMPVKWSIYLTHRAKDRAFYPHDYVLDALRTQQVSIVTAGAKVGDVDVKMVGGMNEYFKDMTKTVTEAQGDMHAVAKSKLIVIASGDRDFSESLHTARDMGFRTMIAHFGPLSKGYTTQAEFVWGQWETVRREAQRGEAQSGEAQRGRNFKKKSLTAKRWHLTAKMNHRRFGKIIGVGGATHKRLERDHGVKLYTWDTKLQKTDHSIPISGPCRGIVACCLDLTDILSEVVNVIPEERDAFEKASSGPSKVDTADVGVRRVAAQDLRKWITRQDGQKVNDVDLGQFYVTASASTVAAVKEIGVKQLAQLYPNELVVTPFGEHQHFTLSSAGTLRPDDITSKVGRSLSADGSSQTTTVIVTGRTAASVAFFLKHQKGELLALAGFDQDDIKIERKVVPGAQPSLQLTSGDEMALLRLQTEVIQALDRQVVETITMVLPSTTDFGSLMAIGGNNRSFISIQQPSSAENSNDTLKLAVSAVQELAAGSDHVHADIVSQLHLITIRSDTGSDGVATQEELRGHESVAIAPFADPGGPQAGYGRLSAVKKELEQMGVAVGDRRDSTEPDVVGNASGLVHRKTKLCTIWQKRGSCHRGTSCDFAHGKHQLQNSSGRAGNLPRDAAEDQQGARALRKWLLLQDSEATPSNKLARFYTTIRYEWKIAMKETGLKNLVLKYPEELVYIDPTYDVHFQISAVPMSSAPTVASARSARASQVLEITGSPDDVVRAMTFLSIECRNVVDDHVLPDNAEAGRALVDAVIAEVTAFGNDSDLPFPVTIWAKLNGNRVSKTTPTKMFASGKISLALYSAHVPDGDDEASAITASCDGLLEQLRHTVREFRTDSMVIVPAMAAKANSTWRSNFCSNHSLLKVVLEKVEIKAWRLTAESNHSRIGRVIGPGGANIKKLHEDYDVSLDIGKRGTDQPIQIRGSISDIARCLRELSKMLKEDVSIVADQQADFDADHCASLHFWGSTEHVEAAKKELDELNKGHDTQTLRIQWPTSMPWLSRLVAGDKEFGNDVAELKEFCATRGVVFKQVAGSFAQVSGPDESVKECASSADALCNKTKNRLAVRHLEFRPAENAFISADNYGVLRWSCKEAKKLKGHNVIQAPRGGPRDTSVNSAAECPEIARSTCIANITCNSVFIEVHKGSILAPGLRVACIVNAANARLDHRGGIAAAIAAAAGAEELDREGVIALSSLEAAGTPLNDGKCVLTSSCRLADVSDVVQIAHTVVPIFQKGNPYQYDVFKQGVTAALVQADAAGWDSIAIPLIGSGVFLWPINIAAGALVDAVTELIIARDGAGLLRRVVLIDVDATRANAMKDKLISKAQCNASVDVALASQPEMEEFEHHQWEWSDHGTALANKPPWIKYDADQNIQIETRWWQHQHDATIDPVVHIAGDVNQVHGKGKKLPGKKGSEYLVNVVTMEQRNTASSFPRCVRRGDVDIFLPNVRLQKKTALPPGWTEKADDLSGKAIYVHSASQTESWVRPQDVSSHAAVSSAKAVFQTLCLPAVCLPSSHADTMATAAECPTSPTSPPPVNEAVLLYSLRKASLDYVEKEVRKYVSEQWATSDEPISFPCGAGVPSLDFHRAAEEAAQKSGAEIDFNHVAETLRVRVHGQAKLPKVERDVIKALHTAQANFITTRDAPPESWEDQDQDTQTFDVDTASSEFIDVVDKFRVGPFPATVVNVQRIQHKALWKKYVYTRTQIAEANGGSSNERCDLKHGTGQTPPETIIDSDMGIDQRYCDAGMYGKGAYFAELTAYSHDGGYRHRMPDGKFQIFVCRVLAGKVWERNAYGDGTTKHIRHPEKGANSVHGPVAHGAPDGGTYKAFIVYEKHQCYPEYLVTYTV
eukprot:m.105218 g.105218  ORF g.105218 m.105218 type:complete len:2194 (-) comp20999_c0_seq1:200-6781(-)